MKTILLTASAYEKELDRLTKQDAFLLVGLNEFKDVETGLQYQRKFEGAVPIGHPIPKEELGLRTEQLMTQLYSVSVRYYKDHVIFF